MTDPFVAVTVAEAFMQFSQATVSALRAYEQGTRARLIEAEDELRALRHERDDALRDLDACKDQTRACVAEVDRWKAEADRALLVNQHQAELVAQLRQEAQQWKDQCFRLEETLRGEIKSWKDQFLRIDAERTRLLHQQLSSATSSHATLIAHTPKHVPFPAANSSTTSSATKRGVSASSSSKDNRVPAPAPAPSSPTKAPAFPRIVRRVQAVIEVPVKEEEEEEEEGTYIEEEDEEDRPFVPEDVVSRSRPDPALLYPSSTTPTRTGIGPGGAGAGGGRGGARRQRRKSSASLHQQHQRRSLVVPVPPSDDGNYGYVDDGEEPRSDGSDGGEYVDEEEVENAIANGGGGGGGSGTPATAGLRTVPWGRKHLRHEPDEEDDELMMYAKDNPHKVRPRHENLPQRPPYRKSIADATATAQHLSATNASAQKRRTTETGSAGVARAKRRR